MTSTRNRDSDSLAGVLFVIAILVILGLVVLSFKLQIRAVHWAEASLYIVLFLCAVCSPWILAKRRSGKKQEPFVVPPLIDEQELAKAWNQEAILIGYTLDKKPWVWSDKTRILQAITAGMNGSGKSTLLGSIISQDLMRQVGPPGNRHRIPMLIFDGKGDSTFFDELLPHIHRAGRMDQLRILNPSRPEISSRFNPFWAPDDDYMARVNMIFGAFNLDPRGEFFPKHQLNYLENVVRILYYTGLRYNFYDVIVLMLDEQVLREQIDIASGRIEHDATVSTQQRLNFQMSARNLLASFQDSRRVEKIQGLINECMTFTDDKLAAITAHYDDLLTIEDVLDQELILFVSLNANKNTDPTLALGKMILQNVQLAVGTLYEDSEKLKRPGRPLFSVVFDEFAPFIYPRFAHILHTARGSGTAFLFSLQALPQLEGVGQVGRGFKVNVYSAANSTFLLRTKDEDTAKAFTSASAERNTVKESVQVERSWFGLGRYREIGRGTQHEEKESRSQDWDIKNLPKGRMQALVGDDSEGVLHATVQVRPPTNVRIPGWKPEALPVLQPPRAVGIGANLRFKHPEAQREFDKQRREFDKQRRGGFQR